MIDVQVRLPRERWTVTTARALAGAVLATASHAVRAEVQLAISEACANAVVHAEPAQDYELRIRTGPCWCEVRVIDSGNGFELTTRRPCRQ